MAKKATAPKPRTRRPKQGYLDPTFEPPSIKEIDQAAENYYDAMKERIPLTKAEAEAKETLITAMVKHGQTRYEFDGYVVMLTDSKNVKVQPKKEPKAESNGQAEE